MSDRSPADSSAWEDGVYRALGHCYSRDIRRPAVVTSSSGGGTDSSKHTASTSGHMSSHLSSDQSMGAEGLPDASLPHAGGGPEVSAIDGDPSLLRADWTAGSNPTLHSRRLETSSSSAAHDGREFSDAGWYPMCFYAQMLGTLDAHRSVSGPPSPRGHSVVDTDGDAKRMASRLGTYARGLRSASYRDQALEVALFNGVERRATECAAELHEVLSYVRNLNQATRDAQRQLVVSKSIDVPRAGWHD